MSWIITSEAREEMSKCGGQSRGRASAIGRSCHGDLCARATHEEILYGTQGHRKSSWIRGVLESNPRKKGLQREKGGPGEVTLDAQLCAKYRGKPGNHKSRVSSGHFEAELGRKAP